MRTMLTLTILLVSTAWARGGEVVLTSPDRARTFAYGQMVWRQLSVDPARHALVARITFSNLPYAGSPDSRVDEPFDFVFPGTHTDLATRTVFVRDRRGNRIAVARFKGDPANGWADLTAEAKIYLVKESGRVTAFLTATNRLRPGMRWIQVDDNWSLQNFVTKLCRR